MGGSCCVAARDKPLPYSTGVEISTHRNIRYSPSWSFRWDNRTHIEDIIDVPTHSSQQNSGTIGSEPEGFSDGSSPLDTLRMPRHRNSPRSSRVSENFKVAACDKFIGSNSFSDVKDSVKSSLAASASDTKRSLCIASTPLLSRGDPSTSTNYSLPSDLIKSRNRRCSPRHQLSREVSESRIPSLLKSLNENSSPEESQSFVLSTCSNDLSNGGSQGGSSDGWSMRTFTELVTSSQRERWSIGNESPCFTNTRVARSNAPSSLFLSTEAQTCGVCSKLLKDGSVWSTQKIVASSDHSVVAILVCGHVYHAECLEMVTTETNKYDPTCPICTTGEKHLYRLLAKLDSKVRSKISRDDVADIDIDGNVHEHQRRGKGPKFGASSSMKSSFSRPFLKRQFSIGSSRPVRPASNSDTTKKKGFWARYRRN